MLIEKYGVALRRIRIEDAELIRQWRNDQKINQYMFHQGVISSEMQTQWFLSVNNSSNYFFLILKDGIPIGLINTSSIDWEAKTAFTGLFIYDDSYLATEIPVCASLSMLDLFLGDLGIAFAYAKVRGNNQRAHQYNASLGFNKLKKIELGLGYEYLLQPKDYFQTASSLRNYAAKRFGAECKLSLDLAEPADHFIANKLKQAAELSCDLVFT